METRLLKMFCEVARAGSVVAASRKLHLTASAVSHALKALETEVGSRLFDRVGKKLILNQAGEYLLSRIQQPLAALAAAEEAVRQLGKWGQSRLRIGAAPSACQYLLPLVIRDLKKSFPRVMIQVESGDMPEMAQRIEENEIDLALGVAPGKKALLETALIFKDELLFACAPSHSWADGHPLSREELRRQPLILYQRNSVTYRLLEEYFKGLNLVPTVLMEIGNIEAIKEMLKLNLGVAVLAPWTSDKELAAGSLRMRPLGPQALRREWVIASLAGRRLSLVEETVIRLCRGQASSLRLDRRDVPRR